jgi:hypothetical protein
MSETSTAKTEISAWMQDVIDTKARVAKEIAAGGTLEPCPYCKLPRCERSSYIRCSRCGINWSLGTDLSKHPHSVRVTRGGAGS